MNPRAIILGCAGPSLSAEERRFFSATNAFGFILFARNIETPAQTRNLITDLRQASGRSVPVLIDQEGGRVQRLRPPHWRAAPPAARFGDFARSNRPAAIEAARLNARLIGGELADLGIDMVCAPVLDLRYPGAHDVIGDRAFSSDPDIVAALGRASCEGFFAAGVTPIVKHIPGHGRSMADSHISLPVVEASLAELAASDFLPFKALSDMPWAMTAHILYRAIDPDRPATTSRRVITQTIRGQIGFEGMLLGDDLSMNALAGTIVERATATLAAGCDLALHCNGKMDEMRLLADAIPEITPAAKARLGRARKRPDKPEVMAGLIERLERLLAETMRG